MPVPSHIRIADRKDLKTISHSDFVVRDRNPKTLQVIILCFLPLFIVILTSLMIYKQMLYTGLLCILIGIISLFFAMHGQRYQKIINHSEFLNALLAAALTYDHKFCAIISEDHNIVYLDHGFQDVFPDFIRQPSRTMETLFSLYKIAPESQQQLMSVLQQKLHASIIVSMENGSDKKTSELHLFVDPIKRPSGFFSLRGK